jgi:small subunit ribosomal protein S17
MSENTTQETKAPVVKTRNGVVVKAKMQKTVVVEVTRRVRHAKYGKLIKQRARYMAHDAESTCKVGDRVLLEETRPLSKNKRWRVKEVVTRAPGV